METEAQQSFAWVRQIPGDLVKLDETPLFGFPPPFPWAEFSSQLGRSLQIDNLSVQPGEWQWRPADALLAGLGEPLISFPVTLTPLAGQVWWAISEEKLAHVIELLITKQRETVGKNIEDEFFKAFYRFLGVEAVNAFEKVNPDKKLAAVLANGEGMPSGHCLCLDVAIDLLQETLHGRLFLSPEFRRSWAQRYLQQQSHLALSSPLADTLNVTVSIEAGRVKLKPSEWKEVAPGDFLFIDNCSLDPDEDKGRVLLVINNLPFFRARLKEGSLKLLEHPLYYEVDTPMNQPPQNASPHSGDKEEDEDFDLDTHSGEEDKSEDFDIDELGDLDLEDEPSKAKEAPAPQAKAAPSPPPAAAPAQAPAGTAQVSIEEIPLSIVIEIGRIQMPVKKLLELQPGNMLELNIHPESGVDLVVNGKRIAKGEILRIGDAIGVRILELS